MSQFIDSGQDHSRKFSSFFQAPDNSTDDLEVRVTLLEDDVADLEAGISVLQDEVEEVETDNTLQNERFLVVEGNVAGNSNDIDGRLFQIFDRHAIHGISNIVLCFLFAIFSVTYHTQIYFDIP